MRKLQCPLCRLRSCNFVYLYGERVIVVYLHADKGNLLTVSRWIFCNTISTSGIRWRRYLNFSQYRSSSLSWKLSAILKNFSFLEKVERVDDELMKYYDGIVISYPTGGVYLKLPLTLFELDICLEENTVIWKE